MLDPKRLRTELDDVAAQLKRRGFDLDTERFLQFSSGNRFQVSESTRWQIELAAAEALARIGRADASIAEPHLADERAYVRRRARQVLAM